LNASAMGVIRLAVFYAAEEFKKIRRHSRV
jgi:hypothetical protein